ncbi:MAG: TauD/TfdA family dioxygenase [Sphingomicrobium sp.]
MTRISLPDASRPFVRIDGEPGDTLDALDRAELRSLYNSHGALLLRGITSDLDAFSLYAREFCPVSVHNDSGNRALIGDQREIQTVNLGTRPFPLHPELSREPWKPDSCLFYCVTPPSRGGATTICDGVAIVRDLPSALRNAMAARRIKYIMPAEPLLLDYWLGTSEPDDRQLADPPPHCPYRFERVGSQIARVFSRPLLHRPMFIDERAFGNFLLFARYLRGVKTFPLLDDGSPVPDEWVEAVKRASDPLTVPIEWQAGDLLILDNSRFMHGRTAIAEGDQRLIATYFGYLGDAPRNPEEPADPIWRRPGFVPPPTGLSASE